MFLKTKFKKKNIAYYKTNKIIMKYKITFKKNYKSECQNNKQNITIIIIIL